MEELDDFTRNMLERAKLRRQKLSTQRSQSGWTPRPLRNNQASNLEPTTPLSDKGTYVPDSNPPSSSAKSKLQQLGDLYSDQGLTSPIHNAEEKILTEARGKSQPKCRLGRLNELASTINQWEDDPSHPDLRKKIDDVKVLSKKTDAPKPTAKVTRTETKLVESTVTTVIHMATIDNTEGTEKVNKTTATITGVGSSVRRQSDDADVPATGRKVPRLTAVTSSSGLKEMGKQTQWDEAINLTLESQGINPTNEPKQTYSFGDSRESSQSSTPKSSANSSPSRSPRNSGTYRKTSASPGRKVSTKKAQAPLPPTSTYRKTAAPLPPSGYKKATAPNPPSPGVYNKVASPVGYSKVSSPISKVTSPFKRSSPSPRKSPKMGVSALDPESSVLKKAAMFEKHLSPAKKTKDPAELTLAERKALFEKNKGEILLPKVAFATSLPANMRTSPVKTKISPKKPKCSSTGAPSTTGKENSVNSIRERLERDLVETTNKNMSKLEREKDMEFLKNRWNRNKTGYAEETTGPAPPPPPMPTQISPVKKSIGPSPKRSSSPIKKVQGSPKLQSYYSPKKTTPPMTKTTPEPYKDSPETLKAVQGVRKIVVSPPKKGKLYPNLSDIEASDKSEASSPSSSNNDSKNSNIYLNMSFGDILEASKNMPLTPPRTQESVVLSEMDEYLDNALGQVSSDEENEGPTPPKQRGVAQCNSSFEYQGTPRPEPSTPLLRTVSLYRKEQISLTPVSNSKVPLDINEPSEDPIDESAAVKLKMHELKAEIKRQVSIMTQASNALSLCMANVEFVGSEEQIESERHLLLAEKKRMACEHEYQRLKVEGTLRPKSSNTDLSSEQGSVIIDKLTLNIKRDSLKKMAEAENMLHFVCLVRCDDKVIASPVVRATGNELQGGALHIPGELRLDGLYGDFKITVEVYHTTTGRECWPHNFKYHLPGKRDKRLLTPIKSKKTARLLVPDMQGPANLTSSFKMDGFIVFSLIDVKRTQWTINRVGPSHESPLEDKMGLQVSCSLKMAAEHRGFLNMFDDVSGLGAWHRRWCLLSAHHLSYWKYPEHENTQVSLGTIDLRSVITPTVGQVAREICARNNTFLLETTRPRAPHDAPSLVLLLDGQVARIRHLLCADTKEEALEWCGHINKALRVIRAWNCQS